MRLTLEVSVDTNGTHKAIGEHKVNVSVYGNGVRLDRSQIIDVPTNEFMSNFEKYLFIAVAHVRNEFRQLYGTEAVMKELGLDKDVRT